MGFRGVFNHFVPFLALLSFSTSAWAKPMEGFWGDTSDFSLYVAAHRNRATALAIDMVSRHRREFPDVKMDVLLRIMDKHDRAKEFERISRMLISIWGKNLSEAGIAAMLDSASPSERPRIAAEIQEALTQRDRMNRVDKATTFRILRKEGLLDPKGQPTAAGEQYLKAERIADLVDRYMYSLSHKEFGVSKMKPASVFLKDPRERWLASKYEAPAIYKELTWRWGYDVIRKRAKGNPNIHRPRQRVCILPHVNLSELAP